MRGDVGAFELLPAATLDVALALLAEQPGATRPIAGGTDLMVLLSAGKLLHRRFVDIFGLDELRGVEVTDDAVVCGALTTYAEVRAHAVLAAEFPMLARAARETGGWAIQNRGTLGGNVVNASPAADSPPALLAYDAELELRACSGARWVPYASFHTGYKQLILRPDELVTRIRLPRARGAKQLHVYRKVGPRRAQAISKVCLAARVDFAADGRAVTAARVALGGVAPTPVRVPDAEAALARGGGPDAATALAALGRTIAPIDDVRSTAHYRRRVAENLLRALAERVAEGADRQHAYDPFEA
jgi:CO/xanthine dehydrogenase FAD-binding subunit